MSMLEKLAVSLALTLGVCVAGAADAPRLGQPIAPNDLASGTSASGPTAAAFRLAAGHRRRARPSTPRTAARPAMARRVAAARAVRWSAVVRSIPPIAIR